MSTVFWDSTKVVEIYGRILEGEGECYSLENSATRQQRTIPGKVRFTKDKREA